MSNFYDKKYNCLQWRDSMDIQLSEIMQLQNSIPIRPVYYPTQYKLARMDIEKKSINLKSKN